MEKEKGAKEKKLEEEQKKKLDEEQEVEQKKKLEEEQEEEEKKKLEEEEGRMFPDSLHRHIKSLRQHFVVKKGLLVSAWDRIESLEGDAASAQAAS